MAELTAAEAAQAAALEACKTFMHVDGTDEDDLIGGLLMPAAKAYLANAGIPEPEEDSPLYNLAVYALTLHYHDHRDAVGGEADVPSNLRPVINQMKHSGDGVL